MRPKVRKLLEFLQGGDRLESQIVGSGLSAPLNDALFNGWVDIATTSVKEPNGAPAAAYKITDKGRSALKGDPP